MAHWRCRRKRETDSPSSRLDTPITAKRCGSPTTCITRRRVTGPSARNESFFLFFLTQKSPLRHLRHRSPGEWLHVMDFCDAVWTLVKNSCVPGGKKKKNERRRYSTATLSRVSRFGSVPARERLMGTFNEEAGPG